MRDHTKLRAFELADEVMILIYVSRPQGESELTAYSLINLSNY